MEFCLDHCENSSCETCDEKYYYGIEKPKCCEGYHF